MPFVLNPTHEEVSTKICGNWFTFKPGQKKILGEDLARFISMERKETGLVVLPAIFEEQHNEGSNYFETPEGKAIVDKLSQEGITNLVNFHRQIIANNQISLRRDLNQADEKVDPAVLASQGELNSMRLVAKYQKNREDAEQQKIDEVKKMMEKIGPLET